MRFIGLILALLPAVPVLAADSTPDPFHLLATPNGCALVLDKAPDEYRVDALADGGVVIGLMGATLPPQEKDLPGTCVSRFRVWATAGGEGTSLEVRPSGVEFSGVIRSRDRLQVVFAKVTNLGGSSSSVADSASRSYRLGVGDVLKITVYNHEDLTKEATVGADGTIGYSLLGDVLVAGKSASEAQEELTAALAKNYIVNPQVNVEVKTYASQFVYVNGPMKTPGRFPLQGGLTMKDVLSLAGGFSSEAGYAITVARQTHSGSGEERTPESIKFARKDIEFGLANLELQSGDVVTVSEKDYFYIGGEVREPGKYELGSGLTLFRAIQVAKGLTDWADRKRVAVIRDVAGKPVSQTINLRDIERMKGPDVPLVSGDIIHVPRRIL